MDQKGELIHVEHKGLEPFLEEGYLPEKPLKEKRHEYKIRQDLIKQGLPQELASAVLGYTPEQIPFIYRTEPSPTTDGNSRRPMETQLWIGTTDAVWNLHAEWSDQIPEVIAQWRGHRYTDKPDQGFIITRTEVHQLPDGSFVELEYSGVTAMGQFDGELSRIALDVPTGTFRPWGGPRERNQYAIYYFKHNKADSGMDNVPGGALVRKDQPTGEWEFPYDMQSLGRSNVTGTTILNGFQEFLNFRMDQVRPAKADYSRAFRYTALPGTAKTDLLEGASLKAQESEKTALAETFYPRASRMMQTLAPSVREFLAAGKYQYEAQQMAVDGILNHPDKIRILGRTIESLSRQKRFEFAQVLVRNINEGKLVEWLETLKEEPASRLVDDTADINARHLIDWFRRTAPAEARLDDWLARAEEVVYGRNEGKHVYSNDQFEKCFDGMCTAFVERYIEFAAQQYLGNAL